MASNDNNQQMRKRHFNTYNDLKNEYDARWKPKHQDISHFIYPEGGRFINEEQYPNDGDRRDLDITDNTATLALRALKAGMYSGVTSPASKWFRLTIDDPDLKELSAVRQYFDDVTEILLTDLGRSNFYTSAETVYGELGAFGTAAVNINQDPENIFNFVPYTMGEYLIDTDHRGRVNRLFRVFWMRAHNVVSQFGEENVSQSVKQQVMVGNTGMSWVKILHIQEPNEDRDVSKLDSKNKKWRSVYYEFDANDQQAPLRESGNDTQAFAAPRWSVTGTNTWGTGPGDMSLGDTMMLQQLTDDILEASAKSVAPPVQADGTSGKIEINSGADEITWNEGMSSPNGSTIEPLYQPSLSIDKAQLVKQETQTRINSAFFADLFFLLSQQDNRQKTATEIIATQQENLRLMGPIIERLFPEYLRIVIERCFDIENQLGRLPVAPPELQGREVKIEIISLIAQAQRLTVVTPIQQMINTAATLAQVFGPEVLDKFNPDQIVDELAEVHGVPNDIIVSDEVVALKRENRRKEIARQQALAEAQGAISSVKELSETDTSGDNALTALAGGA
jgi:hypothetical protein